MTTLYLIRHCEAAGNAKRLFQGLTDCDISETGAKQLSCLKSRFRDIPLERVYASPLIRAQKTALAVAEDKGLPVEPIDGLTELDAGDFDGKPFSDCFGNDPVLAEIWDHHPEDFAAPNGESMRHAYERGWNALLQIVHDNPGKTVAAATHGGLIRCLICRLLYDDITKLKDTAWSENTAVSKILFDDSDTPTVLYCNDTSHVPETLLPKRNRLSAFIGRAEK